MGHRSETRAPAGGKIPVSTGPVTATGKARVARNGWKGGVRAKVRNWHRTVSQIILTVESLYSLVRPKRKNRRLAETVPMPPVFTWNFAAEEEEEDDDDEMDAVDRMSPAEVQAALQRLRAA